MVLTLRYSWYNAWSTTVEPWPWISRQNAAVGPWFKSEHTFSVHILGFCLFHLALHTAQWWVTYSPSLGRGEEQHPSFYTWCKFAAEEVVFARSDWLLMGKEHCWHSGLNYGLNQKLVRQEWWRTTFQSYSIHFKCFQTETLYQIGNKR